MRIKRATEGVKRQIASKWNESKESFERQNNFAGCDVAQRLIRSHWNFTQTRKRVRNKTGALMHLRLSSVRLRDDEIYFSHPETLCTSITACFPLFILSLSCVFVPLVYRFVRRIESDPSCVSYSYTHVYLYCRSCVSPCDLYFP